MTTIGRLARKFGLSRSALLYYDKIGLLKPSYGGNGAYRHYSEKDVSRLEQILALKETGLCLADIRQVLDGPETHLSSLLEKRLLELQKGVSRIRSQQRLIVGLLQNKSLYCKGSRMTKKRWVGLLEASGFSEEDMWRWHRDFEANDPDRHREFLEFLGIRPEEIRRILVRSRQAL